MSVYAPAQFHRIRAVEFSFIGSISNYLRQEFRLRAQNLHPNMYRRQVTEKCDNLDLRVLVSPTTLALRTDPVSVKQIPR